MKKRTFQFIFSLLFVIFFKESMSVREVVDVKQIGQLFKNDNVELFSFIFSHPDIDKVLHAEDTVTIRQLTLLKKHQYKENS